MEHPMQKLNDLSRSPSPLDPDGTLIAVIELSLSSWLVAGIVPGVERQPLKKLAVGSHRYKDTGVHPLSFELYDERNNENFGFRTRLGTWLDEANAGEADAERGDKINFAQMKANPQVGEYPAWNSATGRIGRGHGATNFEIGTFSLVQFRTENAFMAEPFKLKYGIDFDAVLFAVWAAAFFGTYVGITMHQSTMAERRDRTMNNFTNLMFRGYTMVNFDLDELAREAVWFAEQLQHEKTFPVEEVRKAVEFICLSGAAQKNIGLWSGGKRPILVPSMGKLMIDLAAILPVLQTIFFGVRKAHAGGVSFENAVRNAIRARGLDLCLQGNSSGRAAIRAKSMPPSGSEIGSFSSSASPMRCRSTTR
jgi:transposase